MQSYKGLYKEQVYRMQCNSAYNMEYASMDIPIQEEAPEAWAAWKGKNDAGNAAACMWELPGLHCLQVQSCHG